MTEPTITQLDDGYYRVCLAEDAIEACTTCSSAHLIDDKVAQLKQHYQLVSLQEAYAA